LRFSKPVICLIGAIFIVIICILHLITSIEYCINSSDFGLLQTEGISLIVSLLFLVIAYYWCGLQNFSFCFSNDSLLIKSIFLNKAKIYQYANIKKIKLSTTSISARISSIYFTISYKDAERYIKTSYIIDNIGNSEYRDLLDNLNYFNIKYSVLECGLEKNEGLLRQ
jgi:hypothetical protein